MSQRILHMDSIGGASGDMLLGALIDLGVPADALNAVLQQLTDGAAHLHSEQTTERGIYGTRVTVHAHDHGTAPHHHHEHEHEHGHTHASAHEHERGHGHEHDHDHAPHRNLTDIRALIEAADLPQAVRDQALTVFQRIGEAEAAIHHVPLDKIHFHEVGALDSIADIVGCCWALHHLQIDAVTVAALPMGHGVIECAHGTLPNPAPATLALCHAMPVTHVDEPYELVTPTGAALLTTWRSGGAPPAGSRPLRIGYGLGQRALQSRPNVIRATLYESDSAPTNPTPQRCAVLECTLDDSTPEWIGQLCESLLAAGALDVFTVPAQMKKQRPGVLLTVLCDPPDRAALLDRIFRESTTFGIRYYETDRATLTRRTETVTTAYGPIRLKIGTWQGQDITVSPEMADCINAAQQHKIAPREVHQAAQTAWANSQA
jgi:pyridinium-3,5-bisthiocarboxylic acid mononucleotide nickel chelatase